MKTAEEIIQENLNGVHLTWPDYTYEGLLSVMEEYAEQARNQLRAELSKDLPEVRRSLEVAIQESARDIKDLLLMSESFSTGLYISVENVNKWWNNQINQK